MTLSRLPLLLPTLALVCAAALPCRAAVTATAPLPKRTTDAIDILARATLRSEHVPGLSLAVVRGGKVVYARGYGYASLELKSPARADTIYPIGSLTKQFTASAILLLIQDGKLKTVDQPFAPLLPKLKLPALWSAITVRELLNQTSGLDEYLRFANTNPETDALLRRYTPQETVDLVARQPLSFTPGTQFEYSNTNYFLLGEIVAEQSGRPYADFLRQRLFAPLGMGDTGKYDPQAVVSRRAAGYLLQGAGTYNNVLMNDADFPGGAGELESTPLDLAKWDAALSTELPLTAASKRAMWSVPSLDRVPTFPYGFGWIVQKINGRRLVWHNGAIAGGGSWMGRYVDDKLTVIVQCNALSLDSPTGFVHQLALLGEQIAGVCNPALKPPSASAAAELPANAADAAVCRRVFDGVLSGHPDPDDYTPAVAKALLASGVAAQTRALWLQLGAFQRFEPMGERQVKGQGYRAVRCRCVFAGGVPVYDFCLADGGTKIVGILPVRDGG